MLKRLFAWLQDFVFLPVHAPEVPRYPEAEEDIEDRVHAECGGRIERRRDAVGSTIVTYFQCGRCEGCFYSDRQRETLMQALRDKAS